MLECYLAKLQLMHESWGLRDGVSEIFINSYFHVPNIVDLKKLSHIQLGQ